MSGSRILFMMTGSIAAYKACHAVSRLVQAGHQVQVVASPSALQFVGHATLEGLTGKPVLSDLWEKGRAMDHIHLIRQADLVLVAPATAHFLNRAANGIGEDLLTTLFLAHNFKVPFLVAPAMNTTMYLHPATQASLAKLREMGVTILEAASGVLACGETGYGKLLEPDLILAEVKKYLPAEGQHSATQSAFSPASSPQATSSDRSSDRASLQAPEVLITAGGTREKLDDVRVITNLSTGKSGAALADTLSGLGFNVTLLRAEAGAPATSMDVQQKTFVSFDDLEASMKLLLKAGTFTHVIQMAAVSDYKVQRIMVDGKEVTDGKAPSGGRLTIEFQPTTKLISKLKVFSPKPLQVAGFKLTSGLQEEDRKAAAEKIIRAASADVVMGNDLSEMKPKEGVHPYTAYTKTKSERLDGFESMAGFLAQWILGKEIL